MIKGKISIVMPIILPEPHNKFYDMTVYSINCIQNFTKPEDYELIIIESAFRNDSKRILMKHLREGIDKHITFENNYPQPSSLNLGIKESTGEYICLVDNDCFVSPGWLDGLKKFYARGYNFVGGQAYRASYDDYQKQLEEYRNYDKNNLRKVSFVSILFSGTFFAREDYEKIGPFDEKLTFNKWDVDYQRRIMLAKMKTGLALNVIVSHVRASTYNATKLPVGIDNYWDGELAERESVYYQEKWKDFDRKQNNTSNGL